MKPILFIHVTKTAGGSIKRMLRESNVSTQFHYPGEDGYKKDFSYDADVDTVYGHFRYGMHEQMKTDPVYACFLRDPRARTISHFHHLKNVARNAVGDRAREHGDIGTFLRNTKNMDLDNLQTRMISGIGRDIGYQKLDQSAVDLALENLRKTFVFIGMFEQLQESIEKLNELFPDLRGKLPPHVNKGKYEDEIDEETLALIDAHNVLDQQLYDQAKTL